MFDNFIKYLCILSGKLRHITKSEPGFAEPYLEETWANKTSAIFYVFYKYRLSLKALISESDDYYDTEIDKLEQENPIPSFITFSGLFAVASAESFYDENQNIKIFKKFLMLDYKAPEDPFELQDHLFTIYLYYLTMKPTVMSFEFASQIDYVMAELVRTALMAMQLHKQSRYKYIRTLKSTKTIRMKASERKQEVIEAYYRLQERQNMTAHRKAREIQDHFEERRKKPPSPETIKKYLREADLI